MAINEKSLLKAMKNAAKKGGYKMEVRENDIFFFTDGWYVHLNTDYISRPVLALLVEHTGRIPEAGEALLVLGKEEPQTVMRDAIAEEIRRWTHRPADENVLMAPMMFHGLQLFQSINKHCYGVNPAYLDLMERDDVEKSRGVVLAGDKIMWQCVDGNVILPAIRPTEDGGYDEWQSVWQALESVQLK